MRPPEFTGGNDRIGLEDRTQQTARFNEAAGIHRRKRASGSGQALGDRQGFNEAAGIHRRKPAQHDVRAATGLFRFNEAAGIHRRKHVKATFHGHSIEDELQ